MDSADPPGQPCGNLKRIGSNWMGETTVPYDSEYQLGSSPDDGRPSTSYAWKTAGFEEGTCKALDLVDQKKTVVSCH